MARLSRQEIKSLQERLAEWQAAEDMFALVDGTMDRLGSVDLFTQGGLAFLRDAWIAGKFGVATRADAVRLEKDQWPDFEVRFGDNVQSFEAVEADEPGRRRGDEYRQGSNDREEASVEEWAARADQVPAWLQAACGKKADKRYSSPVSLVIYLNLSEYGVRQNEVEASFAAATESAKEAFETIWVLWKETPYQVWPRGSDRS